MPIIIIGSGVLLLKENHVLLQRRKDNGLWAIPGGRLEPGETPEDATRREVQEETGAEIVGPLHLFNVYSSKDQFYQHPNGDQIYDVCAVCWTRDFHGALKAEADEVLELGFYAVDDLPQGSTLWIGRYYRTCDTRVVGSWIGSAAICSKQIP